MKNLLKNGIIFCFILLGALAFRPHQAQAAAPTGNFDSLNCTSMYGWAYDPDIPTQSITVKVFDNGTFVTGMSSLTNDYRPDVNTYFGITGNHGFSFTTPSSMKDGTNHVITVKAVDNDGGGTNYLIGSITVNCPATPPNCSLGASPDNDWTIANSGTRSAFANGVTDATQVLFPTWSDVSGQDDIIWYSGTDQGGGVWKGDINLASHPGLGTIFVHVYLYNAAYSGGVVCDSANFIRLGTGTINVTSSTSTSWTITCPLTNPNRPNVNSGANQTAGTYPSKPSAAWTITPADIEGYDWQVTGCALNTPCAQTIP